MLGKLPGKMRGICRGNPVCIASLPAMNSPVTVGINATVMGWGDTNMGRNWSLRRKQSTKLHEVDIRIQSTFDTGLINFIMCKRRKNCRTFQAGTENLLKGACRGDSGGPLVVRDNGTWVQLGIVSFISNENCLGPASYTYVSKYIKWISENTKIDLATR